MRLTTSPIPEKGFRTRAHGEGYRVMMDGQQLKRVMRVDTCAGVAWVADTDENGNVRFDRQREEIITRRIYGPIRLERITEEG